jgi:hypothetical protein
MKKHLAAAGIAMGSILGGVALGATVFAPSVVGAQESTTTTEPTAGGECPHPGPGQGRPGPGLDAAAEALGITEDELHEALEGGQTLADVAAAQGVDVQAVIDAMVADLAEHLAEKVEAGDITQEQADARIARATEAITARANGEEPPRPEGRGPRGDRPAPPAEDA